jgi:hypothetical protein
VDTVATGERRITYDARGLAEPNAEIPKVSDVVGEKATFNAAGLTTRQINLELRWLTSAWASSTGPRSWWRAVSAGRCART